MCVFFHVLLHYTTITIIVLKVLRIIDDDSRTPISKFVELAQLQSIRKIFYTIGDGHISVVGTLLRDCEKLKNIIHTRDYAKRAVGEMHIVSHILW